MKELGHIEYFVCGGFGGIGTVLIGHPFDTIKVRLQTMPVPKPGEAPLYAGMLDCAKKTIANEGFHGLYRGMGAPLTGVAPIFAIYFLGYKIGRGLLGPADHTKFTYMDYFFAGCFSGILTVVLMAPGERIKCLLQVQPHGANKIYSGPVDVIKKLYSEGGIRNMYRGAGLTLLRDIPGSGGYFMTYEVMIDYLSNRGLRNVTVPETLFAGGTAGAVFWIIGMPFDVLKSRIQTAKDSSYTLRVATMDLIYKEGPHAFYKGLTPVLFRAFPANAACFMGFEMYNPFFMSDLGPISYFFCGGVGGICSVLVGHPFDTIKVRLQTMPVPPPGEAPLYAGTYNCVKKVLAREGVRGLYKGMGAPLVGVAPIFAISFMGYKLGKELIGPTDPAQFIYRDYFLAGAFSGIFTTTLMAPGERIKCLLQIQHDSVNKTYNGPVDVIKRLYSEGGIRSIYRGTGATLLRDIPASGTYFMTYEVIINYLTDRRRRKFTIYETLFAGGSAGVAFWIVGLPLDVLKSRIQTAKDGYSIPNAIKDLLHKEGPRAFYKGITPVLLRSFPANAACFLGFEMMRKFINILMVHA